MSTLNYPTAMSEKDIPSLEERAKIIKSNGTKAICQINHAGCLALKEMTGLDPVVPSAEVAIKDAEKRGSKMKDFHELNNEEIKKLIEKFAYAAELSIKSGYDGVEIHVLIISLFNNFILLIQIKELMIGVVQMKKE